MLGTYKINNERIPVMKGGSRWHMLKIVAIVYCIILVLIVAGNLSEMIGYIVILTAVFGIIALVLIGLSFIATNPVYNTIIEIKPNGLVRVGEQLKPVHMEFAEIGRVVSQPDGTVLLKKGIRAALALQTLESSFVDESSILFIPKAMDQYEEIVKYVKSRVPAS